MLCFKLWSSRAWLHTEGWLGYVHGVVHSGARAEGSAASQRTLFSCQEQRHKRARPATQAHFLVSAYFTSTNISLAKASHVAEPKIKGPEVCHSSKTRNCDQALELPHHLCPKQRGRGGVKPCVVMSRPWLVPL